MNDAKIMMKMANLVLSQISELGRETLLQNEFRLKTFCEKLERILKDAHLYESAVQRNWQAAAKKVQTRTCRNIGDLNYEIQTLKSTLDQKAGELPMVSDVLAEFMQLEDEYGQLRYNWKEKTLSVTTDPIVLDDVALGSFEIKLFLDRISRLGKDSPYRIIALEPNPAGSNDEVTHPHVSNELLCEGDGHLLIRKALEQGRLCDFFSLVIGILNTYNPDSPYVALSDWDGYSCYDCGYTMSRDDSYFCEQCENDFCSQCSTYCQICDTTVCLGCSYECPACQKPVCKHCVTTCPECEEKLCSDCMAEKEICNQCEQERKENENEDEQTNSTAA